jgi:hypothetical protein
MYPVSRVIYKLFSEFSEILKTYRLYVLFEILRQTFCPLIQCQAKCCQPIWASKTITSCNLFWWNQPAWADFFQLFLWNGVWASVGVHEYHLLDGGWN